MNQTTNMHGKFALLALSAILCLAAAARAGDNADTAKNRQPNVVIFLTDDQGTLDANCYGAKDLYTPTMDELAKTGVRFTQAYAHCVCCPTRAMLMTGRYPHRVNVSNWTQGDAHTAKGRNMPLEEITLAELLKSAGYKTGLMGKWHLGADLGHGPQAQGFDEFFGFRGGFIDNFNHHFLHGKGFHDLYDGPQEIFAEGKYFPEQLTKRAIEFVDRNREVPFFLYVAFNLPHYPEQGAAKFDARYKDLPMPRQSYAKVVSTVDDQMGQILDRLKQHGLRDNTIVLFMSDNGYSTEDVAISVDNHQSGLPKGTNYGANAGGGYSGKWRGNKGEFFEGGIRVPAILSWPGKLPQNVVRDQAVTAMDWFPTVAELCGVTLPAIELDGQSIVPIIKTETALTHHKIMHWAWQSKWAVRDAEWKLIQHRGTEKLLVNLQDEKPEEKNYLAEKPEIAERLQKLHDEWTKNTNYPASP